MTLVPFKIVGQIVAAKQNEDGKIIREQVVGEMVLYEPEFDLLRERIEMAWPQVEAQAEAGPE